MELMGRTEGELPNEEYVGYDRWGETGFIK